MFIKHPKNSYIPANYSLNMAENFLEIDIKLRYYKISFCC